MHRFREAGNGEGIEQKQHKPQGRSGILRHSEQNAPQRSGRRGGDAGNQPAQNRGGDDPWIEGLVGEMPEGSRSEREALHDPGQARCEHDPDLQRPARVVNGAERQRQPAAAPLRVAASLNVLVLNQASPGRGQVCPQALGACIAPAPEIRPSHVDNCPKRNGTQAAPEGRGPHISERRKAVNTI